MAASHREDENEEVLNSNEEGWVKVESYKPDGVRVNTPDKPIIIEPNDNAVLDVLKGMRSSTIDLFCGMHRIVR